MRKIIKENLFNFVLLAILLLGVLLRLKGLWVNPSMWHDECGLAFNIIDKSYADFFGILNFHQTAPPFFMIATKLLTSSFNAVNLFATCDLVIRLIPFFSGVLSIFVFYLLCKETFETRLAVTFATFLFAINNQLINYSFEFKPYCSDMLLILLIILFFMKLDLAKIGYKKLALFSTTLAFSIWFSFVSAFAITAGCINLITKRKNFKKIGLIGLPILISGLLYLKFYVLNTYIGNGNVMLDFWGDKFISPNFSNFLPLLIENLRYFFFPAACILFMIVLMIYGAIIFYKERKYGVINLILLTFLMLITSSILHVYPFSERLVLFLIPIFLILMTKPIDEISRVHKVKSFFILITFLCVLIPQMIFALDKINMKATNKGEFPKEMMAYIVQNIKPTDKIFVNAASNWEYQYYSSFFNIDNKIVLEQLSNTPDSKYLELLNGLERGKYWFFLPYDYSHMEIINFVKDWAKANTEIIYIQEATQSALIYLEKSKI